MKYSVLTLVILTCGVFAQWSSDPAINLQVSSTTYDGFCPMISPGAHGDTYIAWAQADGSALDMRMQRFDLLGMPQWGTDGILVCDNFSSGEVYRNNLITDKSGSAVLSLCVEEPPYVNLYTYRVSPDGNMLWGADGILLSDSLSGASAGFPSAAATPSGDVVISWSMAMDPDTAWTVMQRIEPDGSLLWGDGATVTSDSSGQYCWEATLCPTGSDDVILNWMLSDHDAWHKRIYSMKYDDSATPVWSNPAIVSETSDILQQCIQPPAYADGSGGEYIVWQEYDTGGDVTSLVQHVNSNGSLAMASGGVPVSTTADRNNSEPFLAVSEDFADIFIFWREMNDLETQNGLYGQRMNSIGSRLWTDNGLAFIGLQSTPLGAISVQTAGDSAAVFYLESTGTGNDMACCMLVDSAGGYLWGSEKIEVSNATCGRDHFISSPLCWGQQWIITWADDRNPNDAVFTQNVQLDGTLGTSGLGIGEAEALNPVIYLGSMTPNPAASTAAVSFTLESSSFVLLGLFDTSGRAVSLLTDGFYSAGNHTVNLDTESIPAGVYLLRLDALGESASRTCVVIR